MKKLLFSLGAITATVTPVVAVISCGTEETKKEVKTSTYKTLNAEMISKLDASFNITKEGNPKTAFSTALSADYNHMTPYEVSYKSNGEVTLKVHAKAAAVRAAELSDKDMEFHFKKDGESYKLLEVKYDGTAWTTPVLSTFKTTMETTLSTAIGYVVAEIEKIDKIQLTNNGMEIAKAATGDNKDVYITGIADVPDQFVKNSAKSFTYNGTEYFVTHTKVGGATDGAAINGHNAESNKVAFSDNFSDLDGNPAKFWKKAKGGTVVSAGALHINPATTDDYQIKDNSGSYVLNVATSESNKTLMNFLVYNVYGLVSESSETPATAPVLVMNAATLKLIDFAKVSTAPDNHITTGATEDQQDKMFKFLTTHKVGDKTLLEEFGPRFSNEFKKAL